MSVAIEAEPKASTRSVVRLVGIANLVICAVFLLISLPFYWTQIKILETWPKADAQVLSAEVALVRETSSYGSRLHESHVRFLFTVDGRAQIAEERSHRSPDIRRVRYETNKFQVGSHRTIRYNPRNHADIRVNAGLNRRFFFAPLLITGFAAIFGAIGGACMLLARRRRTRLAQVS